MYFQAVAYYRVRQKSRAMKYVYISDKQVEDKCERDEVKCRHSLST